MVEIGLYADFLFRGVRNFWVSVRPHWEGVVRLTLGVSLWMWM